MTGATELKETSLIGAIGTRTTKEVPMCHHTREIPPGIIRISSLTTKEIKGQETSTTTVREVKGTSAIIRGVDQTMVKDQVPTSPTIDPRGI